MLKALNADQARFVALLARTARLERDAMLGHVVEGNLDGVEPARGDHNPTAELGLEPVPPTAEPVAALRDALAVLSEAARRELYTLMRIGQGDLAANKWHRGLADAERLDEAAITAAMLEDVDLHEHIMKGLYEAGLAA